MPSPPPPSRPLVAFLSLFALSFTLNAFRIDKAPDIHGDEIMYYQAGTNLAEKGRLTWLADTQVWVHPPLFFVAEAAVSGLLPSDGDIFDRLYAMRLLSCFFGALTAGFLYLLVRSAFGELAGWLAGLLFLLDPFVLRISRRIMLETQMELLIVVGLYLFYRFRNRFTPARLAGVAFVFGLALLTKELAAFSLVACVVFGLLRRRPAVLRRAVVGLGLAFLVWGAYPAWSALDGTWDEFRKAKLLGVERLVGVVPTTSWKSPAISLANAERTAQHRHLQNLPSVGLVDALLVNAKQYASSYLLIALAPFLAIALCLFRPGDGPWLLFSWLAVTLAFLAAGALLGTVHVQFAYMILPPACAIAGAALAPSRGFVRPLGKIDSVRALAIAGVLLFGVWRWALLFGTGLDDSYRRLAHYLHENVPPGTVINASQMVRIEPAPRWLFPDYELRSIRQPEEMERRGIRYAVLSSKDVWGGYGKMSAEYVEWLRSSGRRVFHAHGNTFWDLELFELPVRTAVSP